MLTQLEVANQYITVFVCEFIAKCLHGVSIDQGSGCFTFCVNCTSNVAETFAHIKANCVNVAVGGAAAILNVSLCTIEAIFEAVVDSIETITESIGDATELSVYILIVETFEEVRASNCSLYCGVTSTVSTTEESAAAENRKPYKVDEPFVTG